VNRLISKINKLRNLAQNNSNANEAAVAAAMADKLMREHVITTADLDLSVLLDADPVVEHRHNISRASWTAQLAWAIGKHCRVRVLRSYGNGGTFARIFGHQSDVEVFLYLYEVARREVGRAAKIHKKSMPWLSRTAMTSFREGAVRGLSLKLKEQRAAASQADTSTEVALRSRYQRAREWGDTVLKREGSRIGTYGGGVGASHAGINAGRAINLNPGIRSAPRQGQRKLTG
tara:strand:- start:1524 stop:2219 length:696 start_codon:yes stop_codon:yes gene_type:complete